MGAGWGERRKENESDDEDKYGGLKAAAKGALVGALGGALVGGVVSIY